MLITVNIHVTTYQGQEICLLCSSNVYINCAQKCAHYTQEMRLLCSRNAHIIREAAPIPYVQAAILNLPQLYK